MPTEYTCSACSLKVTLGWFHAHDVSDGYGASTLLMCGQCGAQHSIRIAIDPEARASMMRPRVFWDVVLTDAGEHRVKVMHALHHALECGLHEAMALVRSLPVKIGEKLWEDEAHQLRKRMEAAGAHVSLLSEPMQDVIERKQIGPYIPQAQDELSVGIPTPDGGMEWQPCQVLGERLGPAGRMNLQLQQCARCHARGALVSELPANANPCPGCGGQQTLEMTGGWIT